MASNTDQDSHNGPGGAEDQKVRVHSGTTGAKMAGEGAAAQASSTAAEGPRGGPPPSDMTTTTGSSSPSTYTAPSSNNDHHHQQHQHQRQYLINRDDYSGLQVVDPPGLEVSQSHLPEALPPSDPEARYAELYKGSPPQALHPSSSPPGDNNSNNNNFSFLEAVSPGSDGLPYSPGGYSKTNSATYQGGHNPFETEKQPQHDGRERRIMGLRRMVFWCVLAVVIFVVVAGVAVGVGVGLGTRDDSSR
jgi:hypothetical protein